MSPPDPAHSDRLSVQQVLNRVAAAAQRAGRDAPVQLLAVSKTQPSAAIRTLAAQGQRAFGENYVQEALAKQAELADLDLAWHLIGHLQSNKCRLAANAFDWVQSVDRASLVERLDAARDRQRAPLNVLIQVDIDDEPSKSGCRPEQVAALVQAIRATDRLRLRGLMAIPAPVADDAGRRRAFARMRALFETVRGTDPDIDTLSMGMSADFELAVEEGATLVRIGSALFGPRPPASAGSRYPAHP